LGAVYLTDQQTFADFIGLSEANQLRMELAENSRILESTKQYDETRSDKAVEACSKVLRIFIQSQTVHGQRSAIRNDSVSRSIGQRLTWPEHLEEGEITRLLKACAPSRNPYLPTIVTVALKTGMRKGELLGLQWERVDLAAHRITLYRTNSGKPRGVPTIRPVYDALVALEPDEKRRTGLVFHRRGGAAWGRCEPHLRKR
jgi:integrase